MKIDKMFKSKELLIVNEKGITDNSFFVAIGLFISWEDIEEIYMDSSIFMGKVIELKIKNEEKYLNNFHWWEQKLFKFNKYVRHQIFLY